MGQVLILLTGIDVADNDQRNVNLFLSHGVSLLIAMYRNLVQPLVNTPRNALLCWQSSSVDGLLARIVPTHTGQAWARRENFGWPSCISRAKSYHVEL
jgi:hypothetical protein